MKPYSARISDILSETIRGIGNDINPNPTIADFTAALGNRSFGIVLVLFGLPNLLPVPGLPMLCGVIIGVVAYQMMMGRTSLALPAWLGRRRVSRKDLAKVFDRAEGGLRWVEKVMRPRLPMLVGENSQQLHGVVLMCLAIALMAPIPFFGGIPPGIAVILIGLALAERDGVFAIAGWIATVFALIFTIALTYAILRQIVVLFLSATGMR
ncbi:MAG: exopolysaccharide biosynthesis protein [Proteobacteria bacterium]|nr:exopolysaccharide biosynthesis protein [Pseudomonadota bacterium]